MTFPCKIDREGLTSISWHHPNQELTLTDKHYLKVLSKAIEQSYLNSLQVAHTMLAHLHTLTTSKHTSHTVYTMHRLHSLTHERMKSEEYGLRKQFYEYSIETESLRLMEHEAIKEANKRNMEMLAI